MSNPTIHNPSSLIKISVSWLHALWHRLTYRQKYREFLQSTHHVFDVSSLRTTSGVDLEAESILVELYLEQQAAHQIGAGVLNPEKPQKQEKISSNTRAVIWHYLRTQPIHNLVILAGPGYGKTTLLKHIALMLSSGIIKRWRLKLPNKIPILLYLSDLVVSIKADAADVGPGLHSIAFESNSRLRRTLLECSETESHQQLRALFVDQRIIQWRDELPEANNQLARVLALLDYLYDKANEAGENALVLFLQVLRDHYDPADSLHLRLNRLAEKLAAELAHAQVSGSWQPAQATFNKTFLLPHAVEESLPHQGEIVPPPGWFARQLTRGNCLVMLDGLDEVGDAKTMRQVVAWVNHQITVYPKARFLVAARPHGLRNSRLHKSTVLQVMNLNDEQIEQFVNNWYLAIEMAALQSTLVNQPLHTKEQNNSLLVAAQTQARGKANDFLVRVDRTQALADMAANPLLLTMMLHVHCYRGTLPEQRVDLYAEAYEVLLGRRSLPEAMAPLQKQYVLQPLAYWMTSNYQHEIAAEEATAAIQARLTPYSLSEITFLQLIEQISGLLWQRNDRYGFTHATFREYLTAVHVRDEKLVETLATYVGHAWWHETIRLYAAMADVALIVNSCLSDEELSEATFQLALECLDEAHIVGEEVEEQLEKVLYRCLVDPHQKQIVAKALTNIQLNRLRPIVGQRSADSGFITHAEYQLFLHEQREANRYLQPDHWHDGRFPTGTARRPVIGVRPTDAQAFCEWLQTRDNTGSWRYRLPTINDLADKGFHRHVSLAEFGYWVSNGARWQCFGHEDPLIKPERVQQFILADVNTKHDSSVATLFLAGDVLLSLKQVVNELADFDFQQTQYQALQSQIRSAITAAHAKANTITNRLASFVAELEQTANRHDEQAGRVHQGIAQRQSERQRIEAQRRDLHQQVHEQYVGHYQEIEQIIAQHQANIRQIEEQGQNQRTPIEAEFRQRYREIDDAITTVQTWMTELQNRRQPLETNEYTQHSQIDSQATQAISTVETYIATTEQERGQIQAQEQSEYDDLNRQVNQALVQYPEGAEQIEMQRRDYYQQIQSHYAESYRQIDATIQQYRRNIQDIEAQRRNLHAQIQTDYRSRYDQIDKGMQAYQKQIEELRTARQQEETNERDAFERLAQHVKQAISETESQIRKVEDARKAIQEDERTGINTVDSRIEQVIAPIQTEIDHLQTVSRMHALEAQDARQRASQLRQFRDRLPTTIQSSIQILSKVEIGRSAYFTDVTGMAFELTEALHQCCTESHELFQFIQKHFASAAELIIELRSIHENLQQILHQAQTLVRFVEQSRKLTQEIGVVCSKVHDIQFDELQTAGRETIVSQALVVSLETAYHFLCARMRDFIEQASSEAPIQRLHYTRLCALAIVGKVLVQMRPANDSPDLLQHYLTIYVKLCILEARIRGELPAFEGIRIVREPL